MLLKTKLISQTSSKTQTVLAAIRGNFFLSSNIVKTRTFS